jgi:phosphorylase kinase alpha/beta subunit
MKTRINLINLFLFSSSFQKRQMDGALCRVPTDFFEHIWSILERTPGGIKLCDAILPQVNFSELE